MFTTLAPAKLERIAIDSGFTPQEALRAIDGQPWPFALTGDWAGGGAIVGSSPVVVADAAADPFALLDALPTLAGAAQPATAVGGGWFGWLGYRLGRRIELLPEGPRRPVALPEFHLAYYDHVVRLDERGQWWFEALVSAGNGDRITRRLEQLCACLTGTRHRAQTTDATPPDRSPAADAVPERHALACGALPAQLCLIDSDAVPAQLCLIHNDRDRHLAAVDQCRRRIDAGEIYQANICLRLEAPWRGSVTELYARALDRISPTRGATFKTPWGGIASLSPELFLRRAGDHVVTAPIKGTIKRPEDEGIAQAALAALRRSAKDAAEHVMIVDLMRNDLGRVCAYGTIEAPRLPEAEPHPGVWHLVSKIRGRLRSGVGNADLLRATFPPGSVTGAPKVQAMRVISELERTGREVYTGAIGFASPVAGLELSVAIRTFEQRDGRLWLGAGGGIVADSDPAHEFEEALTKAAPLAAAIGSRIDPDAWGGGSRIPAGGAERSADHVHDRAVAVR